MRERGVSFSLYFLFSSLSLFLKNFERGNAFYDERDVVDDDEKRERERERECVCVCGGGGLKVVVVVVGRLWRLVCLFFSRISSQHTFLF